MSEKSCTFALEMIKYLDIHSLFEPRWSTSLRIIRDIMGVPEAAVLSIARSAGMETTDWDSACIDENALSYFADAHVRKVKSWFHRTKGIFTQLGPEDQMTFLQFCHQFKKPQTNTINQLSWNDINTDAIREQFICEVKKKSNKPKSVIDFFASAQIIATLESECILPHKEKDKCEVDTKNLRSEIMRRVTGSYLYHIRIGKPKQKPRLTDVLHRIQIAAHYHVYISSDEDHITESVTIDNGLNIDQFIHRTQRVAA